MGKENTRTLKVDSYKGKKSSKKTSKKTSKKNYKKEESNTTEEMRQLLDSDTEIMTTQNKLTPYNGEVPANQINSLMGGPQVGQQMGGPQVAQQMGQMNQQMMGMQQQMMGMNNEVYSPSNFDPLMLQQMAPVQNSQSFQNSGMPQNLLTPNRMMSNLSILGKNNFNGMSTTIPEPSHPVIPPQQPASFEANLAINNLKMLGGARKW